MSSNPHPNGAPRTSALAHVFTTLINSAAIASEMALLTPPDSRRAEGGPRAAPAPDGAEAVRVIGGERPLRVIGAG